MAFAVASEDKSTGLIPLYALTLLALLSMLAALTIPFWVRVKPWDGEGSLFKNDVLSYTASIVNRGPFLYPRVICEMHGASVIEYYGESLSHGLRPGGTLSQDYTVRFPYRGVYHVGIRRVTVVDFLGLFRVQIPVKSPSTITVYPEMDGDFTLSIRNESLNSVLNNQRYNEDYTSVADVRKYEQADSLKRVHWKLTAKRGELMVKNFQFYEPDKTFLLLDTCLPSLPEGEAAALADKMVSYVAAAVNHCARGRLAAELVYGCGSEDKAYVDPAEDAVRVLTLLASIGFQSGTSVLQHFHRQMDDWDKSFNLAIFLAGISPQSVDTVRKLLSLGYGVLLYSFFSPNLPPSEETDFLLDTLAGCGASVHKVVMEQ